MSLTVLSSIPRDPTQPSAWARWWSALVLAVNGTISGEGDPEAIVFAPQGTIFRRVDGAVGTTIYAKTTGGTAAPLTNTGWIALS